MPKDDGTNITEPGEVCQNCKHAPARSEHECPFRSDVYSDFVTQCNCCSECMYQCAMDI